ncbi:MAG: T9SS type A sorting domain-containing protein [Cyclobacteriaceae bacterium]|nr:T9SS type A sorting domain-containing protein [Cyclobacteriaceae bacterium SS2]
MIYTGLSTVYTATGLLPETIYYYKLTALDTAGNESLPSIEGSAQTEALPDLTPPSAPDWTSIIALDTSSIELSWEANSEADLAGYNLYSSTSSGFIPDSSNLIYSGPLTSFIQNGLQMNTMQYYILKAFDENGNISANSNEYSVRTKSFEEMYRYKINLSMDPTLALDGWTNFPIFNPIPGIVSTIIKDLDDSESDLSISAIHGFDGSTILGVIDNGPNLVSDLFQDDVARYCAYTSGGGKLLLSNLDPQKLYTISILGSRVGSGSRITKYTINGQSPQYLECINNSNHTVTFEAIAPNENKEIAIEFEKTSSWAYLNVILINESDNSSARFTKMEESEIEQISLDDIDLRIYPNPTSGFLKINSTRNIGADLSVKLIDMNGKVSYNRNLVASDLGVTELDLSHLSAGVYQLVISTSLEKTISKIVIQK